MKPEPLTVPDSPEATVVLSPLLERDLEAIARWYAQAVVLAGSSIPLSQLPGPTGRRRTLVLTDGANPGPFGLMAVGLDDPEPGWATVDLLAIARQEERDSAALAIAMLEAHLQGEARHIRAAVPAEVGLAPYFWLRLGYRPVVSGQGLWMISELEG